MGGFPHIVAEALEALRPPDGGRMLDSGVKPSLAKLTLARRIAATALRMWKDEEEYRQEPVRRSTIPDRDA